MRDNLNVLACTSDRIRASRVCYSRLFLHAAVMHTGLCARGESMGEKRVSVGRSIMSTNESHRVCVIVWVGISTRHGLRVLCTYTKWNVLLFKLLNGVNILTKHAFCHSNPLVEYMLNGTAIKEALANGKDTLGRDCDTLYPGCPLDRTSINGVLNKFLPTAGEQH